MGTSRGLGGGLVPPPERAEMHATALMDYRGRKSRDPRNPRGVLPPVAEKKSSKKAKPKLDIP